MKPIDHMLSYATASTGLGGAIVAQATGNAEITLGAIILSAIGLASLWVRSSYHLAETRLDVLKLKQDLEIYRRIWAHEHKCPFTPTGEPRCALDGGPTPVATMPASDLTKPHSEGS